MSSLAIAGAGPVAQALGRRLVLAGHAVVALASRTPERAAAAAAFVGGDTRACDYEALASLRLPLVIAVTDGAIAEVARRIASREPGQPTIVVHTCGASGTEPLAPLARAGWRCGVCHPLQTFANPSQGVEAIPGGTFGIAGHDEASAWAAEIVRAIDGVPVVLREEALPLYHAAAVLAGNGAFALIEASLALLEQAGIARDEARRAVSPLALRSLGNALSPDADMRLTGPVSRGDAGTIERHMQALADAPAAASRAYVALSGLLLAVASRRGLPADRASAIADALASPGHADGHR